MNWLLISVILVLVFFLLKSKEVKHKFASVLIIVLLLFFIVSFSQVISKPGVNFSTIAGMANAGKLYFFWLKNVFYNVARLTGNAVHMDWGANLTNFSR